MRDPVERFLSKVDMHGPIAELHPELGECYLWTKGKFDQGYGQFWFDGKPRHAHRWWYELQVGPVPEGLVLDHFACERRDCVNVTHVRPTTQRDNVLRETTGRGPGSRSRQTHCIAGHKFTEENTYRSGPNNAWRGCRTCRRIQDRDRKRKKYAEMRPNGLAARRMGQ